MTLDFVKIISDELSLSEHSVEATIKLLDEGATIPFISRYRKEATGALNEVEVFNISQLYEELKDLLHRKEFIFKTISDQGNMTDEIAAAIEATNDATALEDIYLPFKPKRNTRAQVARQRGLEPLAKQIMAQNAADIIRLAAKYVGEEVPTAEDAIAGASDIIAEWVSETEWIRSSVRKRFIQYAVVSAEVVKGKEQEGAKFRNYFHYRQPLSRCSSHQFLAIRRGEAEGFLKMSLNIDDNRAVESICRRFVKAGGQRQSAEVVRNAIADGYKRLIRPSIETEVVALAKTKADATAIEMFADNLRQLLFASPLHGKRVMAIDPGFRTGCKLVCLDAQGNLLHHNVIYPTAPANDYAGSSRTVIRYVKRYEIDAIALGNGTASRETERFLRSLDFGRDVEIFVVSEQGASIYSASEVAREEFPDEDVTVRGAVSIGRRLIDPLAELVKIDPKSIGVGQYQHDVDQSRLKAALDFTVESCVNSVGVNLNTASPHLLAYVAGIGPQLARKIVEYRAQNGDFRSRDDLMKVPRLGEKTFDQCAGFLRIPNAENVLDNTAVHPESYHIVGKIARDLNVGIDQLVRNHDLIASIDLSKYVEGDVGLPTLNDIAEELEKPGRDPRETADTVEFAEDVNDIEDLVPGMELNGIVTNITAFGAFVNIGIKEDGLVHVSEMADHRVDSPAEVVKINQHVKVRVKSVDLERHRVALTMKGLKKSL
ncbi:MAG: RNA-binding transcriptional accessory protein [Muribaculaceae bacterium]|nr:RNA-binding transcriptional accessory protein [Muribaculaceae bacterium]